MKRFAIEVEARPGAPLGMSPAKFLRDCWQERPLLIRGAFPQFHNAISANDLAGLACEPGTLARLVRHALRGDRYRVRNGPFRPADFARLPRTHWTLLVQDVDKWDADVAALLDAFAFLPAWRIDDVMVSYAVPGGGVGAHVDNYDVFLVQGRGRRRWRIDANAHAAREWREDAELRLLRRFTPTHDWVLEPGDTLYLPPGIAHEGTALDTCLTYSVGMRAPALAELLVDRAESVAEPLDETVRYVDPQLRPARDRSEIDVAALRRVAAALAELGATDPARLRTWFGRFITRYRSAHEALPRARPLAARQLGARLARATVVRNPFSRFAWARAGRGAELFAAGDAWACSRAFARSLAARREMAGADLLALARRSDLDVLAALVNAGHCAVVTQRRRRS